MYIAKLQKVFWKKQMNEISVKNMTKFLPNIRSNTFAGITKRKWRIYSTNDFLFVPQWNLQFWWLANKISSQNIAFFSEMQNVCNLRFRSAIYIEQNVSQTEWFLIWTSLSWRIFLSKILRCYVFCKIGCKCYINIL